MDFAELSIFPLDSTVLYPDVVLPLHIFEPRYREMTADALEGDHLIGMVALRAGVGDELASAPSVHEIGCAGRITRHERLPDGRYHLLLSATRRFRILEELPRGAHHYRRARVAMLDEVLGDAQQVRFVRARVTEKLAEVARRARASDAELDLAQLGALAPGVFVNRLAQGLSLPAAEKQTLLEAATIEARLQLLDGMLAFHLALRAGSASAASQRVH